MMLAMWWFLYIFNHRNIAWFLFLHSIPLCIQCTWTFMPDVHACTHVFVKKTYAVTWKLFIIENIILIWIQSIPALGSWVSWVDTIRDLSLDVRVTDRQTRFSSLPWRFRTTVNNRTGWASAITLNLSTQNQVEKVIPDWGGNILSPEKKLSFTLQNESTIENVIFIGQNQYRFKVNKQIDKDFMFIPLRERENLYV